MRSNFSLRAERDAIRRELKSAATSELQMYRHLRNVGGHWIAAKIELGNRGLSIHRWAKDNLSIGRQWLDRHAELYKRWAEFLEARKWSDSMPYAPTRQLGLETAFRLMDEKKRFDVLSAARRRAYDAASKRGAAAICDDSTSVIDGVDFHVGEAMEVLRRLEGQSVHCAVTSPPYFNATRDYQHAQQVGHEDAIDDYISRMVAIFGEVRRVLRDDGSLWVCMGDSYAGAGGAWTDGEKPRPRSRQAPVGYKPKDLILVGARLAMALQADGWLLRNAVVWQKKGIRPESAQDRFTRSYETIYLLTKGARYYFSQTGTREPMVTKPNVAARSSEPANDAGPWSHALERNGRDVWEITTSKYAGGLHPAVYPAELARRCISASCPAGGTVLDPFAGACTTALAALRLGCRATMIDINGDYLNEGRVRIAKAISERPDARPTHVSLNRTAELYNGDCSEVMQDYIADGTVDVAICDVPYFLQQKDNPTIDHLIALNGMRERFDQAWDRFESISEYESFCETWIDEVLRCLDVHGSMFILGVHQNIGLINRILQQKGIEVLHHIVWYKRNSMPNLSTTRLQSSHECVLWAVKSVKGYRFNYRQCREASYTGDGLKKAGVQMRDIWDIPTDPRDSTGHPASKPVALYRRILDVAGRPGGVLLDPFSGGGTGAIAAMRSGMRSVSIERELKYVELTKIRVAKEMRRRATNDSSSRILAAD